MISVYIESVHPSPHRLIVEHWCKAVQCRASGTDIKEQFDMNSFLLEVLAPIILISPHLVDGRRGGGFLFIFTENGVPTIWTVLGIAVSVGLSFLCCCCLKEVRDLAEYDFHTSYLHSQSNRENEEDAENQRRLQLISEDSV